MTAWQDVTLGTSVTATVATTDYSPQARKFYTQVRLRGVVVAGAGITAGATIITLPASHRPLKTVKIPWGFGAAGSATPAYLNITTGGLVTLDENMASADLLTLDGISFDIKA